MTEKPSWFSALNEDGIYSILDNYSTLPFREHNSDPQTMAFDELTQLSNSTNTIDNEGLLLSRNLKTIDGSAKGREFWGTLKSEIFKLVCTKERSYAELRKELDQLSRLSGPGIIIAIASYFGVQHTYQMRSSSRL